MKRLKIFKNASSRQTQTIARLNQKKNTFTGRLLLFGSDYITLHRVISNTETIKCITAHLPAVLWGYKLRYLTPKEIYGPEEKQVKILNKEEKVPDLYRTPYMEEGGRQDIHAELQ